MSCSPEWNCYGAVRFGMVEMTWAREIDNDGSDSAEHAISMAATSTNVCHPPAVSVRTLGSFTAL